MNVAQQIACVVYCNRVCVRVGGVDQSLVRGAIVSFTFQ